MKTWAEICQDPALQDLPYKIETNRHGKLMMSPSSGWHSFIQGRVVILLESLMGTDGFAVPECAIQTNQGVKVPDVGWYSRERFLPLRDQAAFPVGPEIAIEILSPGNTRPELLSKRDLYFSVGTQEFWIIDPEGQVEFFTPEPAGSSSLCPAFPAGIDLDL